MPRRVTPTGQIPERHAARPLRRAYRRVVLVGLGAALGLALMMNGAVVAPYRQIAILALALPLLLALGVRVRGPATRRALGWAMGCAGAFLLWGLVQAAPLSHETLPEAIRAALAHPVWEELAQAGIAAGTYISVAPAQTLAALPILILPFLVFAAMLVLCQDQKDALFAWKMLAMIGLALAALSALLETVLAGTQFFSSTETGRGPFSGIFVNRNVTAAFLTLVACATAGWLMLPEAPRARGEKRTAGIEAISPRRFALAAFLFLVVIALILTRSRAGVGFGLVALTLGGMGVFLLRPGQNRARRLLAAGFAVTLGLAVLLLFGEPMLSRLDEGADYRRWCAYVATWQAFLDRPVMGTGFGTFADVFPRYRDPECMGTRWLWLRAHNSWLELLAGMGLVGAVVLIVALGGLIAILRTGLAQRRSLRALPVFSAAALVFMMLHSSVDFPLQIPGVALYFAALAGVGCAVSLLERAPARESRRRRPRDHHHRPREERTAARTAS